MAPCTLYFLPSSGSVYGVLSFLLKSELGDAAASTHNEGMTIKALAQEIYQSFNSLETAFS